jgi:hypothetical protein
VKASEDKSAFVDCPEEEAVGETAQPRTANILNHDRKLKCILRYALYLPAKFSLKRNA